LNDTHPLLIRAIHADGFVRADAMLRCRLGFTEAELAERPLVDWLHPEDREPFLAIAEQGDGIVRARHLTETGDWEHFCWSVRKDGAATHALGQPVADPLQPLDVTNQTRRGRASMPDILNAMALIVEAKFPGKRCSILLVDRDKNAVTVGAGPSLPDEYNAAVEGLRIGPWVGSCGTAAYWNVPVIVADIVADPLWRDLRDAAKLANVAACWSQPIRDSSGEILGAMALYDAAPAVPAQNEMDGLEIAARMVGLAIERDRLETQLRHAAKMEAIGAIAGGIAHDFNNLLAVIVGNADLALATLEEGPQNERVREMLEDVVSGANSATGLCSQLLTYAGKSKVMTEVVECSSIVEELSKLFGVLLSKKATFELDLEERLGVEADRSQLRQVIMNLMTNAADAIGSNEGKVTIRTRAVASGDVDSGQRDVEYVEISVHDTGKGIDAAHRPRIYDPFFSTKQDGSGLGLSVVRGIVDAHGWQVDMSTSPETGTAFSLLIPRATLADGLQRAVPSAALETPRRVLVVDDEPGVRRVASKILASAGIDVIEAADGLEAVERFRANAESIDCVLLDLNMPKLDGEEVVRELKALYPDVRIVLSSGYTERATLGRFHRGEVLGVIQKPFNVANLLGKVREAMANRSGNSAPVAEVN
jgi:two-component system cell cycle sensor histidine kinase/response regulator CckA